MKAKTPFLRIVVLTIGITLSLVWSPGTTHAATFTVDSTTDTVDAGPGDGVCDDGSGSCTLRAAVMEANALAGADTITMPAGTYTLTIPGESEDAAATGDLDITDSLTINGAGAHVTTINGVGIDRVLHILSGTLEISGTSIVNGSAPSGEGGGIRSNGTLILSNSTVSNNTTNGLGGGISNNGTLTLTNSTVSSNTSGLGGGIYT